VPLEESRRSIEPAYQVVTAKLQYFHVRHLLRRVSSIVTFRPRDPHRHRYRPPPTPLPPPPPWAKVGLATVSPAATQNRSTRILFITEGKTYCISMIRLDEKDRGIIERFWVEGGDERKHMNPKHLSDGQMLVARIGTPREVKAERFSWTKGKNADICQTGVSPTKVRKVPQDSCQLPERKGFRRFRNSQDGTCFSRSVFGA